MSCANARKCARRKRKPRSCGSVYRAGQADRYSRGENAAAGNVWGYQCRVPPHANTVEIPHNLPVWRQKIEKGRGQSQDSCWDSKPVATSGIAVIRFGQRLSRPRKKTGLYIVDRRWMCFWSAVPDLRCWGGPGFAHLADSASEANACRPRGRDAALQWDRR